jgi:hypothetical protein
MGVLMVNDEHVAAQGLVPGPLWTVLMTIAVLLVWAAPGGAAADRRWRFWRGVGLVLLVAVILLYRADGAAGLIQVRPHWWGILGLIGWAYLIASTAYLLVGDRPVVLLGGVALLYLVALVDEANASSLLLAVRPVVFVGRFLGAHGALTLSGAVLTLALLRHRREGRAPQRFLSPALAYAAALAAAGLLLHSLHDVHPAFWINKVRATAAWCLLSAALTVVAWVVAYDLADVRAWRRWPRAIGMAGENALTIYLLAPVLLALFALLEPIVGVNPYGALGRTLLIGTVRSILFAWVVVRLSGAMRARGLALHL